MQQDKKMEMENLEKRIAHLKDEISDYECARSNARSSQIGAQSQEAKKIAFDVEGRMIVQIHSLEEKLHPLEKELHQLKYDADPEYKRLFDESERKEKQSQRWKEAGQCKYCGGSLSFVTYSTDSYNSKPFRYAPWYEHGGRKCKTKTCGRINDKDYGRAKRIRRIFIAGEAIIAVIAAIIINIFTVIPFAINFFVTNAYYKSHPTNIIRIIAIIAQYIIAISIIAMNDGYPLFIVVSIIQIVICHFAYNLPLIE